MTKAAVDQHFDASDEEAKIHTARHGRCKIGGAKAKSTAKPKKNKKKSAKSSATKTANNSDTASSVMPASCNHKKNCKPHKHANLKAKTFNAHHILPVSSVNGYTIEKSYAGVVEAIHKVYSKINWCINQTPNMIGVPTKSGFGRKGVTEVNLPAHNLHHGVDDGYTCEVTKKLRHRIWQVVKEVASEGQEVHFQPDEMENFFSRLQNEFRAELKRRGLRKGGPKKALELKRTKEDPEWYLAFSMATDDVARDNSILSL